MPSTFAAAGFSCRRMAASSSRDETGTPAALPASPSVAQNRSMFTPAAAYFATIPPTQKVSSSGCAKTSPMRRVNLAAIPTEERQDEQEHVEQIEINLYGRDHVVFLAELPAAQDAPGVEHEQTAEDQ